MRRTRFRILLLLLIFIISTTWAVITWHVQFDPELAVTRWTYPYWRTGIENEETTRFLAWAKLKWDWFCRVDMNSAGETIIVTTDICWCTTDDEIQVIANITTLNKVRFRADFATDQSRSTTSPQIHGLKKSRQSVKGTDSQQTAYEIFVHDVQTLNSTCNQPSEQAVADGAAVPSGMTIENGSQLPSDRNSLSQFSDKTMWRLPTISLVFPLALMVGCTQRVTPIANPDASKPDSTHAASIAVDAVSSQANGNKNVVARIDNDSKAAPADEVISPKVDPPLSKEEEGACLFVLQWQIPDTNPDDVKFVSIGRDNGGCFDPSDAAMKRLAATGLNLLPASKASLPEPGEKEEDTHRYRGVEDPTTGKRSYIYSATIKEWIDENTVEISYENFSSPLGSDGGTVIVARENGKWSIKERKDQWFD